MKTYLFPFILLFIIHPVFAENKATVPIGLFSEGDLSLWKEKVFSGNTRYRIITLENRTVLKAESSGTASGLFKEQKIDLHKTPYLNWQWRIENHLGSINEQAKSGDDYSARLYVVVSGGWAFWKTRALNYVWSSNSSKSQIWENAFAGKNAMMLALRSSSESKNSDQIHTWYQEKRNIMEDFKRLFGSDIQYIDAVAIMTDTDNAKGNATAYYGDIFFSAD